MIRRRWVLLPIAIWISCLFLIQILGGFAAPESSKMPSQCPEDSRNCAQTMMVFEGSPEAVHSAAMDWIQSQSRVSTVEETESTSHTVFRTKWMMFPDDFFGDVLGYVLDVLVMFSGCVGDVFWMILTFSG